MIIPQNMTSILVYDNFLCIIKYYNRIFSVVNRRITMKRIICDVSVLICVAVITFFIGFYSGRMSAKNIVNIPAISDAFASGELSHTNLQINPNQAGLDELCQLPGINKVMAENIIAYRKRYGNFVAVSELMYVEGMTPELFEQIRQHLLIGG